MKSIMQPLADYGDEIKRRCRRMASAVGTCRKYLPMVVLVGMGIAMLALWCRKRKLTVHELRKHNDDVVDESSSSSPLTVIVDVTDPTALSDTLRLCARLWTKAKRPRDLRLAVRFMHDGEHDDDDDESAFWDPLERQIGNAASFDWRRRTRIVHQNHGTRVGKSERALWLGTPLWRPVRDWDTRLLGIDCQVLTQHHPGEAGDRDDRHVTIRKFVDWSEHGPFPVTKLRSSAFPVHARRHPVRAWLASSDWCLMPSEMWSSIERIFLKKTKERPAVRHETDWMLTLMVRMRTDRLFCASPHATGFVPIASCDNDEEAAAPSGFDWFGFIGCLRRPDLDATATLTGPSARLIHTLAAEPKSRSRLESVLASLGIRWWPDYARAPFARDGLVWPLDPEEMRIVLGRTVTLPTTQDHEDE